MNRIKSQRANSLCMQLFTHHQWQIDRVANDGTMGCVSVVERAVDRGCGQGYFVEGLHRCSEWYDDV